MAATKTYTQSAYSVLLLQKLLSLRDGISPLTLVLDSLQEPGTGVLDEFMLRAKAAGTKIVYVSSFMAGPRRSPHVDVLLERKRQPLPAFRDEILSRCAAPPRPAQDAQSSAQKTLIVIDSLCQIAQQDPLFVAAFVSSLVSPTAAVLGLYHTDEDGAGHSSRLSGMRLGFGKPAPFQVLTHLSTALVRVHPLHAEVARKRARDRAEEEPAFGWAAGEGALFGYANSRYNKHDLLAGPLYAGGVLLDMELRRRSGRAVVERFVVVWGQGEDAQKSEITVMADHPLFAAPPDPGQGGPAEAEADEPTSTFSLGLTEKQRRDREGIVLPYFDAQTDIGAGEGGRILYDMGREDDFDDEEDEI